MFLEKYLSEFKFNLLIENYEEEYLKGLDENNFIFVHALFKRNNFYFIDDIILNYLEIFEMNPIDVVKGIEKLRSQLGEDFVYKIGNDMKYLEEIINIDDKK